MEPPQPRWNLGRCELAAGRSIRECIATPVARLGASVSRRRIARGIPRPRLRVDGSVVPRGSPLAPAVLRTPDPGAREGAPTGRSQGTCTSCKQRWRSRNLRAGRRIPRSRGRRARRNRTERRRHCRPMWCPGRRRWTRQCSRACCCTRPTRRREAQKTRQTKRIGEPSAPSVAGACAPSRPRRPGSMRAIRSMFGALESHTTVVLPLL